MSQSDNSKDCKRGYVIAFLGPDGAGKSTVIDLVQARLKEQNVKFRSFYFAPGFLPRYRPKEEIRVTTKPHDVRQYGTALVLIKIALMLFEFRVGIPKVRHQKGLLLFDRYIHDLLVDPRRYRMLRVRWWMRLMLRLAPKPDLMIVISAPAEVIQGRKQEVSRDETARQVRRYQVLAEGFSGSLVVDNSGSPEDAATAILDRLSSL